MYPAPGKQRWLVGIEFLDGTFIGDSDDEGVIDRWHRLSWSFEGNREAFKDRMVQRCRAIYGAVLIGIDGSTPDAILLDALAAEGCVTLIRK